METGFHSVSDALPELHEILDVLPAYTGCCIHTIDLQVFCPKGYQDHRRRTGWWFFVFPPCPAQRERNRSIPKDMAGFLIPGLTGKEVPSDINPFMNTEENCRKRRCRPWRPAPPENRSFSD